jgi:hypothetical protein
MTRTHLNKPLYWIQSSYDLLTFKWSSVRVGDSLRSHSGSSCRMALPGLNNVNFLRPFTSTSFGTRTSLVHDWLTVRSVRERRSGRIWSDCANKSLWKAMGANFTRFKFTNLTMAFAIVSGKVFRGGGRGEMNPIHSLSVSTEWDAVAAIASLPLTSRERTYDAYWGNVADWKLEVSWKFPCRRPLLSAQRSKFWREVGSKSDRWVGGKLNCGTATREAGSATYRNRASIPQVEDRLEYRRNDYSGVKYSWCCPIEFPINEGTLKKEVVIVATKFHHMGDEVVDKGRFSFRHGQGLNESNFYLSGGNWVQWHMVSWSCQCGLGYF